MTQIMFDASCHQTITWTNVDYIIGISHKMHKICWFWYLQGDSKLTLWGRVMHICVSNLAIIASDNGLSPGRPQAIFSTNAGILLIGPLETNFSEILIEILTISFEKMHLKALSAKWRPFCLSLNRCQMNTECGRVAGYLPLKPSP